MRRKGVSELIAAVILIAIVLAASTIYISYFTVRHKSEIKTFLDIAREAKRRNMEMMSLLFSRRELDYNHNLTIIDLYVYNYGFRDIHIKKIYVDAEDVEFKIYSLDGNLSNTITIDEIYKIRVTIHGILTEKIEVIIITESNKLISYAIPPE